jgi:hypothetical protein
MRNWGSGKRARRLSVCTPPWLIGLLTGAFDTGRNRRNPVPGIENHQNMGIFGSGPLLTPELVGVQRGGRFDPETSQRDIQTRLVTYCKIYKQIGVVL